MSVDLSIIIVNYNTPALTLNCIRSIRGSETTFSYEIILVDNASSDGSQQQFNEELQDCKFIFNENNLGFSKANNQGIHISKGRYILLLNSDTEIQSNTIQVMLSYMESHPDVGASGCKLLLSNGELDDTCKRGFPTPSASFYYLFGFSRMFPNNPRFNKYKLNHLDPDQEHEVDSLVGAFILVRRETIQRVGELDENFFMYGEDIDWCYRIKENGYRVMYYPGTKVLHYKGASSRKKPPKIVFEFYRAMILFHRKHYARKYPWLINCLVYMGVAIKLAIALTSNYFKNKRYA